MPSTCMWRIIAETLKFVNISFIIYDIKIFLVSITGVSTARPQTFFSESGERTCKKAWRT